MTCARWVRTHRIGADTAVLDAMREAAAAALMADTPLPPIDKPHVLRALAWLVHNPTSGWHTFDSGTLLVTVNAQVCDGGMLEFKLVITDVQPHQNNVKAKP